VLTVEVDPVQEPQLVASVTLDGGTMQGVCHVLSRGRGPMPTSPVGSPIVAPAAPASVPPRARCRARCEATQRGGPDLV
jgi:hypothetical protein